MRLKRITIALYLLTSTPALAESWNCKIPALNFVQDQHWDVEGRVLVGPTISDPPEPRPSRQFDIIANTDKALIAIKPNYDGAQINVITLDKLSGKMQWRLLMVTGDHVEHYEGSCQPAIR